MEEAKIVAPYHIPLTRETVYDADEKSTRVQGGFILSKLEFTQIYLEEYKIMQV